LNDLTPNSEVATLASGQRNPLASPIAAFMITVILPSFSRVALCSRIFVS